MPYRTTILHHTPDPGGVAPHFDWMVATDEGIGSPDRRDVTTWRCRQRPDRLEIGESTPLEAIAPHRRAWLELPIGTVRTLSPPLGTATVVSRGTTTRIGTISMELTVLWAQSMETRRFRIESWSPDRSFVTRLAIPDDSPLATRRPDPS